MDKLTSWFQGSDPEAIEKILALITSIKYDRGELMHVIGTSHLKAQDYRNYSRSGKCTEPIPNEMYWHLAKQLQRKKD